MKYSNDRANWDILMMKLTDKIIQTKTELNKKMETSMKNWIELIQLVGCRAASLMSVSPSKTPRLKQQQQQQPQQKMCGDRS